MGSLVTSKWSGLQTVYVLLLLVTWRSQLASTIGTAWAASPEAEADAEASTYIVHVSQAQIPPNFSEEEEWYSFILASVKGHNELQEFNREQDGPIGTVVHGFAAKLTEAEAEALKSVNGVLSVTLDDEVVELHTSQFLGLNTCSGDPGLSPIPGERAIIELEQGWDFMRKGISKLINLLEGVPEQQFEPDEYMMLYTTIYNMCTQKPPHDYSQQLYDRYRGSFEDYINEMVLPAIRDKHDEFMLRELVRRWDNHKVMIRWLSRFFNYLDRYFIARRSLPGLQDVGLICFRDLVYQEMKHNAKEAIIVLIDKEREGEQIDRALLKNVLGIFVEIGMGGMEAYEKEFEAYMLEDTAGYYQRKALSWIEEDSCPDYMLKAEECLKQERERVEHYLHASSEQKLLETVQHELRSQYEHCSLSMNSSFLTKSILDAGPFLGMAR